MPLEMGERATRTRWKSRFQVVGKSWENGLFPTY
jgi:hypothetical protein